MVHETELRALLKERGEIRGRLRRGREYGLDGSVRESQGELSGYDQHPADLGTDLFDRERDLLLRERDEARLGEIDAALARIRDGTYGRCARCGREIGADRSEAEPASELCLDCEIERERLHSADRRPVEEEILSPPFARTNTDGKGSPGFDGEDALQAVLRMSVPDRMSDDGLFEEGDGDVEPTDAVSNEQYKRQLPD